MSRCEEDAVPCEAVVDVSSSIEFELGASAHESLRLFIFRMQLARKRLAKDRADY